MTQPAIADAPPNSLRAARAVIPAECYVRSDRRAWGAVAQAAFLYAVPITLLAMTNTWWMLIGLWALAGLAVAGLFVLGHDASHKSLFNSDRLNHWAARLCMVPSGHLEAAWDLGHNRIHHGYTAREGFDFVWHPSTLADYGAMNRWMRARHRIEWSVFGAGVYYLRSVWWSKMIRFPGTERRKAEIRSDKRFLAGAAVVLTAATSVLGAATTGPVGAFWMPIKLLFVPFLLFIQIISWTVYVHHVSPEMRWWTRREWSQARGQLESTTILRMPALVNRLWLHNIFVHVPHHVDARIPFHELPRAADALLAAYPDTVKQRRFSVRAYLRSARLCKLYDFEAGHWLPYPRS